MPKPAVVHVTYPKEHSLWIWWCRSYFSSLILWISSKWQFKTALASNCIITKVGEKNQTRTLSLLNLFLCPYSLSILVSVKREFAVVRQDHPVRQPASPSDYQGIKCWSLFPTGGREEIALDILLLGMAQNYFHLITWGFSARNFLLPLPPAISPCRYSLQAGIYFEQPASIHCRPSFLIVFVPPLESQPDYPLASLGTFKVSAVRSQAMKMQLLKNLLENEHTSILQLHLQKDVLLILR